jgi:hypothetical protein
MSIWSGLQAAASGLYDLSLALALVSHHSYYGSSRRFPAIAKGSLKHTNHLSLHAPTLLFKYFSLEVLDSQCCTHQSCYGTSRRRFIGGFVVLCFCTLNNVCGERWYLPVVKTKALLTAALAFF